MKVSTTTAAVVLLTVLGACGEEEPAAADSTLRWDLAGLERLGDGFVYEGWAIVDGEPVSVGRFGLDDAGAAAVDAFELSSEQLDGLEAFVLSIEPETGDAPEPSAVKLLGGDVGSDLTGTLSVDHPAALGTDFVDATASYILATPSTADIDDDFNLGLWFLDPSAGPGPSADLPSLPAGWAYEGWVVNGEGPISTGTFTAANMADSDGAGPDAGPDMTPPFPGQDFIDPAMDLVGATVVISVEPVPDDSPAPFVLKPLVDGSVEDLGEGVLQPLDNNAEATNPTGSVWVE